MRARLSVIVPVLDAGAALPRLLPGLMEGVKTGLIRELVLSDGGSSDETAQIAEEVGALWITGLASRGGQLRRGAEAAGGEWLLFLHADSQLPRGWSDIVMEQMADGHPAAFRLAFDARGVPARLVAGWANLRTRLFHLPYGDQGLLISRGDYDAVGGYDDIPLMEDVAMSRKLGRRLALMPAILRTGAERYRREGWLRRGGRNLWLLMRYLGGADPGTLRRRY